MMEELIDVLIGPREEAFSLTWLQMAVRSAGVYLFSILLLRFGSKRFMGRSTGFDLLVGIMLGSILSRAITGQAPFLPTLLAAVVLVGLHWVVATVAFYARSLGPVLKGKPQTLLEHGEIDRDAMRRCRVGEHDLTEAIRLKGLMDVSEVHLACLERNGSITIIPRKKKPQVVDVEIEGGVKVVRVEWKV